MKKKRGMGRFIKKSDIKIFRVFFGIFLCMCVMIGIVCLWYYGKLQKTIKEESDGYLQEVAARIGSNIERIMDDTHAMLYTVGKSIESRKVTDFAEFAAISDERQPYWKFQGLYLIGKDGVAYDVNGKAIIFQGDEYIRKTVLNGEASMSPLQIVDGDECSVFAVPLLSEQTIGGIDVAALACTYNSDTFATVLSMSAFNKQAYSHIVSKDGTIIIRTESKNTAEFGYNIISSIEGSHSVTNMEVAQLKKNMQNSQSGQIDFELGGRGEYMVYRPLSDTNWYLLTFVPTQVVNEKSSMLLTITLGISGFITVSFLLLVFVLIYSFRKYQLKLEQIAYVDDITGGNTIERFYELAKEAVTAGEGKQYGLVYTNLGKFKVLNEKFGRVICDRLLKSFYLNISNTLIGGECIGRISADNFCVLIEYTGPTNMKKRFESWYQTAQEQVEDSRPVWSMPLTELGIYVIDDITIPFSQMIDRAKLALRQTSHSVNAKLRYAVYDDSVRSQLFREKQLEDMMEEALANREFQMYLQPKYSVKDEQIVGAEALARWKSGTEGMIYPDEFIPLFEKNGFVIQLDLWIFEEVCKLIAAWIKMGKKPIKISINCSRMHLKDREFLRAYRQIANRYRIPARLLEIELTESLVLEDVEQFKRVIAEIHESGFSCSMDDFGSGYSSLSMIQDISVDTLKIDKVFFRNAMRDPVRTESVISNIVGMAKALSMETVAEGVEHEEQVEMLRRIGCDLIQGYVFAKPMPVEEFEELYNA